MSPVVCSVPKKGGGGKKTKTGGRGYRQSRVLDHLKAELNLTDLELCHAMGARPRTYVQWRSGFRKITDSETQLMTMLLFLKGSDIGKKFGV